MAAPATISFEINFEGQTFTGVVDEEAIAVFEDQTDRSIIEVAGVDGRPPKMSLMGSFLAAVLSRHHPDVTRVDGMRMLRDPAVQERMMGGLAAALPQPGDVDDQTDAPKDAKAPIGKKRSAGKGGKKG